MTTVVSVGDTDTTGGCAFPMHGSPETVTVVLALAVTVILDVAVVMTVAMALVLDVGRDPSHLLVQEQKALQACVFSRPGCPWPWPSR